MKIFLFIFKLFISIFIFISCCREHDENAGIIISKLEYDFLQYPGTKLNIPDTCCIRDDSSYRQLIKDTIIQKDLPFIDFTKNSLLINGKETTSGRIYCHREIVVDSTNKIVIYTVVVHKCNCWDKCMNFDYNAVIVPKIGRDYKIEYK